MKGQRFHPYTELSERDYAAEVEDVIMRKYEEGYSAEEISKATGIDLPTVESFIDSLEKDVIDVIALFGNVGGDLIDHLRDLGGIDFGLLGKLFRALQLRRRDQLHGVGRLLRVLNASDLALNLF